MSAGVVVVFVVVIIVVALSGHLRLNFRQWKFVVICSNGYVDFVTEISAGQRNIYFCALNKVIKTKFVKCIHFCRVILVLRIQSFVRKVINESIVFFYIFALKILFF